jgi:hypothetical protein
MKGLSAMMGTPEAHEGRRGEGEQRAGRASMTWGRRLTHIIIHQVRLLAGHMQPMRLMIASLDALKHTL